MEGRKEIRESGGPLFHGGGQRQRDLIAAGAIELGSSSSNSAGAILLPCLAFCGWQLCAARRNFLLLLHPLGCCWPSNTVRFYLPFLWRPMLRRAIRSYNMREKETKNSTKNDAIYLIAPTVFRFLLLKKRARR